MMRVNLPSLLVSFITVSFLIPVKVYLRERVFTVTPVASLMINKLEPDRGQTYNRMFNPDMPTSLDL
jgi:hypothetical protein